MDKFYITTSIPYMNAGPHIGHALEFVQADVLARRHRAKGDDVFFLTGADEHGVKIARTAEKSGKTPKQLVDENSSKFKKLAEILDISNDDFIRTSDQERHWPGAQKLWSALVDSGDIYKKAYRGLYCAGHEAFVAEKDLIGGVCAIHKTKPEIIEEENYFFRLSKYSEEIKSKIENEELRIFPVSRKNEILSLINEGLEDVSFSRPSKDLNWGIPVPGDDSQTIYVWCDALSNYITALGYGQDSGKRQAASGMFKKYWPADIHVIGKDILRFHAAIWPGMLLAAKLPLPKTIWAHGFITAGGEKMSKSLGNLVDPFEIIGKYGVDALRYYLLREIPSGEDGEFTYEKFEERYNADLAKGLGNLASRVLTLAAKSDISLEPKIFETVIADADKNIGESLKDFKFSDALYGIWRIIAAGDKYVDDKKPWTLSPDSDEYKKIVGALLYLVSEIGKLVAPFLPDTSDKIAEAVESKKSIALFPRLR
ncbi:methionine--tRNA ligase [Candidatus Azambacteria bacterium]|nr:methionine--tRNA ligase [Candidatus Azambacteria bacterium]